MTAGSQPLPAHAPGVLPQGISKARTFPILFPQEGLEPCTQLCFAARSVPALGAEGLGTRAGGGRELGGCESRGLLSRGAELMEEKRELGLCLPGFVCCYSRASVCLLSQAGCEPKAVASGRISLVAYGLGGGIAGFSASK